MKIYRIGWRVYGGEDGKFKNFVEIILECSVCGMIGKCGEVV